MAPDEAFVVSELLDVPCRLPRTEAFTFGRDPRSSVVLPVQVVSRRNSAIRWDGERFLLSDEGSTNGTYLNGENISVHALGDGDVIGIGPFEFEFRTRLPGSTPPEDARATAVFTVPGSCTGEIGQVSLPELWQLLELNQKTGVLEVREGERRGTIWFSHGAPLHAAFGPLSGETAALALLMLGDGSFRFAGRDSVGVPRTIRSSTAALLLEAARLTDEVTAPAGDQTGSRSRTVRTCPPTFPSAQTTETAAEEI